VPAPSLPLSVRHSRPRGTPGSSGGPRPAAPLVGLALAALLVGCSSAGSGTRTASTAGGVTMPSVVGPPPAPATPSGTGDTLPGDTVTVTSMSTALGDVLADGRTGRTYYAFTGDGEGAPTCTGACAKVWIPATGTQIGVLSTISLHPGEFKLVARPGGGARQLTVYGRPVYRYSGDRLAGQTKGQAAQGKWFAIGADGKLITTTR